jgi:hypothetical protein
VNTVKPTLTGVNDDLARLKSRLSRSYNKGEITLEQMQTMVKQAESIGRKANEYLRKGDNLETSVAN